MAFKKAERTQLYLRCALFGPSGSGKTMTALRMAKGIAGKMGVSFAVIDTEARSASKYADRIPFDVDDLNGKTIDHYIAAMQEAAKGGYKVLVIDSLSHAWRELTDEVDRIAQSGTNRNTFSAWGKVSPKQKRLVDAILNYPGHIITTMRSKTEWVIAANKDGKAVPEKMGLAPEQGKGIEYEFDLLVELNQRHEATVTKDRTGKFQDETIEKPGEEFGIALYDWLSSGKPAVPVVVETSSLPAKTSAPVSKPRSTKAAAGKTGAQGTVKPEVPTVTSILKDTANGVIQEIGDVISEANVYGIAYFSEAEKEEARGIIKATHLDENGIKDLRDFKGFLAEELGRRKAKAEADKAA
jgi:hypothetical protein